MVCPRPARNCALRSSVWGVLFFQIFVQIKPARLETCLQLVHFLRRRTVFQHYNHILLLLIIRCVLRHKKRTSLPGSPVSAVLPATMPLPTARPFRTRKRDFPTVIITRQRAKAHDRRERFSCHAKSAAVHAKSIRQSAGACQGTDERRVFSWQS